MAPVDDAHRRNERPGAVRRLVEKGLEVSADEKKTEPKWISDLSRVALVAQRMERRSKGTFGAANKGKRLTAWVCACGWEGSSQELKAGQNGLSCPMCGGGELG